MYHYFQLKLALLVLIALAGSVCGQRDRLDLCSLDSHSVFKVQALDSVHLVIKDKQHYCFRDEKLLYKSEAVTSRLTKFGSKVELVSVLKLPQGFYEFSWIDLDESKSRKSQQIDLEAFEIVQIYATNVDEILLVHCSQTDGNDSVILWDTKSNLVSLAGWDQGRFLNVTDWIDPNEISEQFDGKFNPRATPPSIESVDYCAGGVVAATSEDALEYIPISITKEDRGRGKCPWKARDTSSLATFEVLHSDLDAKPSVERNSKKLTLESFAGIGTAKQSQFVSIFYVIFNEEGKASGLCWVRWSPQDNQKQGAAKTFQLLSEQDINLINCNGSRVSVLQTIKPTAGHSEANGFTVFQANLQTPEISQTVKFDSNRFNNAYVDAVLYNNQVYVLQKNGGALAVFRYDINPQAVAKLIGVVRTKKR